MIITITKETSYSFVLLFLLANMTTLSMDLAPATTDKIQQADRIIDERFDRKIFKAHLTGTIILQSAPFGYGCRNCINVFKRYNIDTQQHWPLAPVLLYIPVPKTNPEDEESYLDTTKVLPSICIESAIQKNLQKEIDRRKHNLLIVLDGESDEFKDRMLSKLAAKNNMMKLHISDRIKTLEEKYTPLPRLLPAHLLHSHPITIKDIFGKCCDIDFTFDQHEGLSLLTKEFQKRPSSYTLLTRKESREINEARADDDTQSLAVICHNISEATNEQLAEQDLMIKTSQGNQILYSQPSVGILGYTSKSYQHGSKSNPDIIDSLAIEHQLNGQNLARFVERRQMVGNKRHFTCSLKK